MKQTIYITVVGVILAVLLSVGINSFLSKPTSVDSGLGAIAPVGQTETNLKWFAGGLFAGNAQQYGIDVNGVVTQGGLSTYIATYTLGGNASTTVLAVKNPLAVAGFVDLGVIKVSKAATTTWTMICGTSTNQYVAPTAGIISTGVVPTTTAPYLVSNSSYGAISAGSVDRIPVAATEYLVCVVNNTYLSYWTTSTNAFAATGLFKWNKF